MNTYNPKIHKRKSIRLKGYDYSQKGLYFVTICCQNRTHFYGEIINGKMILNDAGKMIEKWYYELENKFTDIKCDEMIVMPNHFHCIINNIGHVSQPTVGEDLRVYPYPDNIRDIHSNSTHDVHPNNTKQSTILDEQTSLDKSSSLLNESSLTTSGNSSLTTSDNSSSSTSNESPSPILGEHMGSPLHRVIQWFKTMTTNEYIRNVKSNDWKRFDGKLWQRNYWEHIVRNEKSYHTISGYIASNPQNWKRDTLS